MYLELTNLPWLPMAIGASLSSTGRQGSSNRHFHCSPSPMESRDGSPFPESGEDTGFPSLQNASSFSLLALRTPIMALKRGPNILTPRKPSLSASPSQCSPPGHPPRAFCVPAFPQNAEAQCGLSCFTPSTAQIFLLFQLWASGEGDRVEFHPCTPRTWSRAGLWAGARGVLT